MSQVGQGLGIASIIREGVEWGFLGNETPGCPYCRTPPRAREVLKVQTSRVFVGFPLNVTQKKHNGIEGDCLNHQKGETNVRTPNFLAGKPVSPGPRPSKPHLVSERTLRERWTEPDRGGEGVPREV